MIQAKKYTQLKIRQKVFFKFDSLNLANIENRIPMEAINKPNTGIKKVIQEIEEKISAKFVNILASAFLFSKILFSFSSGLSTLFSFGKGICPINTLIAKPKVLLIACIFSNVGKV